MEGFQGRKFFAREPSGFSARRRRQRAIRQVRFRFLDLWIKFGKIISKVCCCSNSAALGQRFITREFSRGLFVVDLLASKFYT